MCIDTLVIFPSDWEIGARVGGSIGNQAIESKSKWLIPSADEIDFDNVDLPEPELPKINTLLKKRSQVWNSMN